MAAATPYNSLYTTVSAAKGMSVVCCKHGAKCKKNGVLTEPPKYPVPVDKNKEPIVEEGEQYVNLYAKKNQDDAIVKMVNVKRNQDAVETIARLFLSPAKDANEKENAKKKEKKKKSTSPSSSSASSSASTTPPSWDSAASFAILANEEDKRKKKKKKRDSKRRQSKDAKESRSSTKTTIASGVLQSLYLGVLTREEAEGRFKGNGTFRIYHQLASPSVIVDNMLHKIFLQIVYKTSDKRFRHFPIRTKSSGDHQNFFVDYGDTTSPVHGSLQALVEFYQQREQGNNDQKSNGKSPKQ